MLQIVVLLGSKPGNKINIVIDNEVVVIVVVSTDCLKLLGVSMDRQLLFDDHISIIYKKSSQRVGVLMQLRVTAFKGCYSSLLNLLGPFIRGKIRRELLDHLYEYVLSKTKTARILKWFASYLCS